MVQVDLHITVDLAPALTKITELLIQDQALMLIEATTGVPQIQDRGVPTITQDAQVDPLVHMETLHQDQGLAATIGLLHLLSVLQGIAADLVQVPDQEDTLLVAEAEVLVEAEVCLQDPHAVEAVVVQGLAVQDRLVQEEEINLIDLRV